MILALKELTFTFYYEVWGPGGIWGGGDAKKMAIEGGVAKNMVCKRRSLQKLP